MEGNRQTQIKAKEAEEQLKPNSNISCGLTIFERWQMLHARYEDGFVNDSSQTLLQLLHDLGVALDVDVITEREG